MQLSEQLTYCTVRLTCSSGDNLTSVGTGFIMALCQEDSKNVPVIITNKHVVKDCNRFEFEFCVKKSDDSPDDLNVRKIVLENAQWIDHPNGDVDLCCLPFANVLQQAEKDNVKPYFIPLGIDSLPSKDVVDKLGAMEEVIMIGYPIGLMDSFNHKPIIRRGITATHIKKKYCGKNEFLIDMACFPGSSGSPVFILNEGTYQYDNQVHVGTRFLFVGVLYAGPMYDATGNVVLSKIPTINVKTHIPTNLGLVINSSELYGFENIMKLLLSLTKEKPSVQ